MADTRKRNLGLVLAGIGVLALAVVVALTTTGGGTNTGDRFDVADYEDPGVNGDPLPELGDPASDPARGTPAPSVAGVDFDHQPVNVQPDQDGPMVLLFLAHWCSFCQQEVPVVQDAVEAGEVPEGVRLVAVATGIDASRPNYPPNLWLEGEDWNVPTIVDTQGEVAQAYGLSGFPYWVVIGAEGEVQARFSGALGADGLRSLLADVAGGA